VNIAVPNKAPEAVMNNPVIVGSRVLMNKATAINVNGNNQKPCPNKPVNGLNIVSHGLLISSVPFTGILLTTPCKHTNDRCDKQHSHTNSSKNKHFFWDETSNTEDAAKFNVTCPKHFTK